MRHVSFAETELKKDLCFATIIWNVEIYVLKKMKKNGQNGLNMINSVNKLLGEGGRFLKDEGCMKDWKCLKDRSCLRKIKQMRIIWSKSSPCKTIYCFCSLDLLTLFGANFLQCVMRCFDLCCFNIFASVDTI